MGRPILNLHWYKGNQGIQPFGLTPFEGTYGADRRTLSERSPDVFGGKSTKKNKRPIKK